MRFYWCLSDNISNTKFYEILLFSELVRDQFDEFPVEIILDCDKFS